MRGSSGWKTASDTATHALTFHALFPVLGMANYNKNVFVGVSQSIVFVYKDVTNYIDSHSTLSIFISKNYCTGRLEESRRSISLTSLELSTAWKT